ncbi:hypothetical protein [Mariniblastus fucicola]|uniref:hypothetical protein n=1 Tax=Mariniblastus fucicola TaxID=980251 RepID=UPI0009462BB6|nr:hypothetical protein [Mariniblastus fucicola]
MVRVPAKVVDGCKAGQAYSLSLQQGKFEKGSAARSQAGSLCHLLLEAIGLAASYSFNGKP